MIDTKDILIGELQEKTRQMEQQLEERYAVQICPFCGEENMRAVFETEKNVSFLCDTCGKYAFIAREK